MTRQIICSMLAVAMAAAIGVTARGQQPQIAPPATGDRSMVPQCPPSKDPQYGLTVESAIKVGGGPLYGAARQRRYLDALRGPGGQVVSYKRTGTSETADGTIVDIYEITYDGLEKPRRLYLDWYHYREQSAPEGLVCGQPVALGPPPIDPFRATTESIKLAIDQGPARDLPPISIDADGTSAHGVMFDHFRLVEREARAAAAAKAPLNEKSIPMDLAKSRTILIAYPVTCEGRTIVPTAIDLVSQAAPLPRDGDLIKGDRLATLIKGFAPPASSIAAAFGAPNIRPLDTVKITYAEAVCPTGSTEISLAPKFTPTRPLQMAQPALPAGAAPAETPVHMQVVIDPDGLLQRPFILGGPEPLIAPATEAIRTWRAEPSRLNGAPLVSSVVLQVRFK